MGIPPGRGGAGDAHAFHPKCVCVCGGGGGGFEWCEQEVNDQKKIVFFLETGRAKSSRYTILLKVKRVTMALRDQFNC